ncbi:MAG: glycosyltransferase family 2 protein [Pseudomonadota bacterium]
MSDLNSASVLTVILNYRTPELTLKACEAALNDMRDVAGEIVVVDNGSGDGSLELLRSEADARGWTKGNRLRVLESGRNGGFGAGVNFGIRAGLSTGATPDFYYLLNSDAWPDPGTIAHLRDFLIRTPKAGLVGSGVRGIDGGPHRTAFRFPSIAGEFESGAHTGFISRALHNSVVAVPIPLAATRIDWTAGASLMIRRAVIDATDGFDERFFLYFEETDLSRRARNLGWTTHYLPECAVAHVGSASTGMKIWARTPQYWFDSRLHYFVKSHGSVYAALATLALICGHMLWQVRRIIQRKSQLDPDWFLRDLIWHSIRAPFRRLSRKNRPVLAPLKEDC